MGNVGNSSNSGNVAIGCDLLSFFHVCPSDKQLDIWSYHWPVEPTQDGLNNLSHNKVYVI